MQCKIIFPSYKEWIWLSQKFMVMHTLNLLEFNDNVMTGNNGAHHRSPYDAGIQK